MADDLEKLKHLAELAEEQHDFARAAELYDELTSIDPDPRWHELAGDAFAHAGDKRMALLRLAFATESYAANGDLLKAMALCKSILTLDPNHRATQTRLAALYARRAVTGPKAAPPPPPRRRKQSTPPPVLSTVSDGATDEALPLSDLLHTLDDESVTELDDDDSPIIPAGEPLETLELTSVLPDKHRSGEFDAVEIPLDEEDIDIVPVEDNAVPLAVDAAPGGSPRSLRPPPVPQRTSLPDPRKPLPSIPLFSSLDEDSLRRLIERVEYTHARAGEMIVRQGDTGTNLYVIVRGTVEISVDIAGSSKVLSELGAGLFFGELALMTNSPRTANARAKTDVDLLVISRIVIGELIEKSLDVLRVLLRFFRDRLIGRLVATSPLFASLSDSDARALAARFQFLEYNPDSTLIVEGAKARGLFVILSGVCDAMMTQSLDDAGLAGEVRVAEFGPGSVIGEISLLQNMPSLVTVRTKTRTWALAMPEAVFRQVLGKHPQMLPYLKELASKRLKELAEQNLVTRLDDKDY